MTRIIALEEHYCDPELAPHFTGVERMAGAMGQRLMDVGEVRLREMDEAGIDLQVLSQTAPATQKLEAALAVKLARIANDRLAETIAKHPTRFAGFATLPTPDPEAAAKEFERCVTQLGFKGAMVHGLTNGAFIDEKRFWPIFAVAEQLDVPVYLHPSLPSPTVTEAYYAPYDQEFPSLLRAGWGFTVETATQAIRIILSGLLDKHPGLKLILGHLGETLPYLLWRVDQALSRAGNKPLNFRAAFSKHFWFTTSGFFSNPALLCAMQEVGIDRIMFSVDWPFVDNKPGVDWLNSAPICAEDRAKVFGGTARTLLKL